jgi:hypothetical protein
MSEGKKKQRNDMGNHEATHFRGEVYVFFHAHYTCIPDLVIIIIHPLELLCWR